MSECHWLWFEWFGTACPRAAQHMDWFNSGLVLHLILVYCFLLCSGCECNNHAQRCRFDPAVYEASGRRSGGVCLGCMHHTTGPKCDQCAPGYQPNPRSRMDHSDACIRKSVTYYHYIQVNVSNVLYPKILWTFGTLDISIIKSCSWMICKLFYFVNRCISILMYLTGTVQVDEHTWYTATWMETCLIVAIRRMQ